MSAITDFLNQDGLNTLWSKIKTYISNNTVAKETGKGLSTNDFTAAYKKLLDSIDSTVGNTSNLVKNSAVNKAISDLKTQIGNLKTINIKVVTELPTSGQESNVIYLIKHVKSSTDTSSAHTGATNVATGAAETYDEYLWIAGDGKFEKIGNTDIDLSAYAKTADVRKFLDSKLSIDTANAGKHIVGFYANDGTIKPLGYGIANVEGIYMRTIPTGLLLIGSDLRFIATKDHAGYMSAADKAKLDGLGSGTKLTYTWDSSTRKIVVSGITLSEYKFYYRTSVGILKEIAPSGSTLTIPTDASSVIEVYCVNNSSNNKSLILI